MNLEALKTLNAKMRAALKLDAYTNIEAARHRVGELSIIGVDAYIVCASLQPTVFRIELA